MTSTDVLKAFGDAYLTVYRKSFDRIEIDIRLWDETVAQIVAEQVGSVEDSGTWECEGLVRLSAADGHPRFAIVDTEQNPTLRFEAGRISYINPDGSTDSLFSV